jgi:hypothetical protein
MTAQFLLSLLTAVVGILVACIAGFYTLRSRQNDYRNDYYKIVVARRIAAYEAVENLIVALKSSTIDVADRKVYHILFSSADGLAHDLTGRVTSQSLWLSDRCFEKTQDISRKLFRLNGEDDASAIEFGKKNYEDLAQLRAELEDVLAEDMRTLHDVKRFFRKKKKSAEAGFKLYKL